MRCAVCYTLHTFRLHKLMLLPLTAATEAQGSARAEQALQERTVPEWSAQKAPVPRPLAATATAPVSPCGS
jgi:hypothetical protein